MFCGKPDAPAAPAGAGPLPVQRAVTATNHRSRHSRYLSKAPVSPAPWRRATFRVHPLGEFRRWALRHHLGVNCPSVERRHTKGTGDNHAQVKTTAESTPRYAGSPSSLPSGPGFVRWAPGIFVVSRVRKRPSSSGLHELAVPANAPPAWLVRPTPVPRSLRARRGWAAALRVLLESRNGASCHSDFPCAPQPSSVSPPASPRSE